MKNLVLLLLLSTIAIAQRGKAEFAEKPLKDGPFTHLIDEPARLSVHKDSVYALGVWVASGSSSAPAGPSVSNIYCSHSENTCHEQMANMVPFGDTFSLNPDSADYRVTKWNENEIVAENRDVEGPLLAGPCHLMGVLKIDLLHKKLYAYQTLTEPVLPTDAPKDKMIDSEGVCKAANNTLWELHAETMFSYSANAKTVTYAEQKPSK
jgi:hypothetical protein